jgi:HD-GYP domain-containing protein (c-di-GMP phosphodiesterase class II)
VARATARRLGLGAGVERALHEIGEWWNGGGAPQGLRGDDIAVVARIAQVAADAARLDHLRGPDAAVAALRRRAGGVLDPAIVGALVADGTRMLAGSRAGDPRTRMLEVEPTPHREYPRAGLPAIAAAFGDLADLKTPFTHAHSAAVARLSRAAGERIGLDPATVTSLEVAAHLHDLGRLAVSNVVWEKPGRLTGGEWEQVRMHAYHSERILATSEALAPLARLAGMHHERLDGSGYHRGCGARDLPVAARILAAADACAAMTQDRPHRPALGAEAAAEALAGEARAGRLDHDAVTGVLDALADRPPRRGRRPGPGGLSAREVEVVRLVAAGCSNAAIAERLVISRRTAEHHVQHVYGKLGVSSRAAVALFAHEHDLLATAV